MILSPAGFAFIRREEGLSLRAYHDAGGWSIGLGCQSYEDGSPVKEGDTISEARANELARYHIGQIAERLAELVTVPLTQPQADALISLVYNIGIGAFSRSTLLAKLNAGDFAGAAEEFGRWNKSQGAELPVLTARRARERALFESQSESQAQPAAEPAARTSKPEPAPATEAPEDVFSGGEGGSSGPRRRAPVVDSGASAGNPAAPWPFPEVPVNETIATAAQAAATIATAVNPPLGALLQVAASLFPKIAGLLQSKDLSVASRNTQIGAAVLDTIANAVGAQNRIDGLARVANDPAARERAQAALEPYFVMASAPEGTVEARKALLSAPIGNKWEAVRVLGYGFLIGLVTLILIIGGGIMLREVLLAPATDPQLKGAIIGFLTGTALAAPILFLFGSSGQSRQKDQTIERLSR